MPVINPKTPTATPGMAADLGGLLPATITKDMLPSTMPRMAAVSLDPVGVGEFVAATFTQQVADNPGLLGKTIPDATRLLGIPPKALQSAFEQLAARTGIALKDGEGSDQTLGDILKSVPLGIGKVLLKQWFDQQGPAVQRLLLGAALGAVVARQGLEGLGKLGLNVSILKQKNGGLSLFLVPDSSGKGLAAQLSGQLRIPLGGRSSITASGRVTSDPQAQVTAGLTLALSESSTLVLGAAYGTDSNDFSLTYANRGFSAGVASVNGKTDLTASQTWGGVTISGETHGSSGAKAQLSVSLQL